MLGYWNRPEETATALRNGGIHTGDGGRMDNEGFVYVVDRLQDVIVTRRRERLFSRSGTAVARHPAVAACAVGLPDADWGERVHAVVVLKAGQQAGAGEIRAHRPRSPGPAARGRARALRPGPPITCLRDATLLFVYGAA